MIRDEIERRVERPVREPHRGDPLRPGRSPVATRCLISLSDRRVRGQTDRPTRSATVRRRRPQRVRRRADPHPRPHARERRARECLRADTCDALAKALMTDRTADRAASSPSFSAPHSSPPR